MFLLTPHTTFPLKTLGRFPFIFIPKPLVLLLLHPGGLTNGDSPSIVTFRANPVLTQFNGMSFCYCIIVYDSALI